MLLDSRSIEYEVIDSALEARSKLKEKTYDLVVLDLDLGSGIGEGKFLLDTMLKEGIFRPTIIISRAGSQPEIIALKGRYDFVLETIDKENLPDLLSVFDRALKNIHKDHEPPGEPTSPASTFKFIGTLFACIVAFVIIIAGIALISKTVSWMAFGALVISSILIFLLLAAIAMRLGSNVSEEGFLTIVSHIIKSLPLLRSGHAGVKQGTKGTDGESIKSSN